MKSQTTVVDIREVNKDDTDVVYIGRQMPRMGLKRSIWANDYAVADYGRTRALELYEAEIRLRLASTQADHWRQELEKLRGKKLACWCRKGGVELPCHGTVLVKLLDEVAAGKLAQVHLFATA